MGRGRVPSQQYWDELEALEARRIALVDQKKRLLDRIERLLDQVDALRGQVAALAGEIDLLTRQIAWREIHWDEVESYYQTAQDVPTIGG